MSAYVDDVSSAECDVDLLVLVVVVEVVVTVVSGLAAQTTKWLISIKREEDAPLYRSNNIR